MPGKAERLSRWRCLSAPRTWPLMKPRELPVDEGGAIRALMVDDERLARRGVREMLQRDRDIEVVGEPANGPEAVMAVRESNPDLMFLDVQMPGMDGFEVLNALRDERLPMVVFITAYDQYALRAFEACAVDYILKPFDRARFERALQQAKSRIRQERQTDLARHLLTLLE